MAQQKQKLCGFDHLLLFAGEKGKFGKQPNSSWFPRRPAVELLHQVGTWLKLSAPACWLAMWTNYKVTRPWASEVTSIVTIKYTFSPAELSSERGEKEVFADSKQPTAPSSTSRTWATAQRALAEERQWRLKVHQARRDDRFSSLFLSLLLTAAIVPTRPTPLLLCSPLPLSLSDQVWCIQRCDCVNCT